jgi:hypothetical protein
MNMQYMFVKQFGPEFKLFNSVVLEVKLFENIFQYKLI